MLVIAGKKKGRGGERKAMRGRDMKLEREA